ncbi:hypothetical protein V1512DRAFT_213262 [Lipomyces arxii]|uniref:uncharacterized protein n=1 Tax=Lipomyces arxii TaxID=56418 RepID=UPI0034CDA9F0
MADLETQALSPIPVTDETSEHEPEPEPEHAHTPPAPSTVPEISIESILGLPSGSGVPLPSALSNPRELVNPGAESGSLFFVDDSTNGPKSTAKSNRSSSGNSRGNAHQTDTYDPDQLFQNTSKSKPQTLTAADLQIPLSEEKEEEFQEFQKRESDNTARGEWERFPAGSRMFIGNLPTDVVNKRNVFQLFSSYGDLAQISLKQAYGFVQFLKAEDCSNAINGEQGTVIQGRKIHLEVSKPQGQKRGGTHNERNQRRSVSPGKGGRNRNGRANSPQRGSSYGGYLNRYDGHDDRDRDRDRGYRREASPKGRDRGYRDRSPPSRYRNKLSSPVEEWPLPLRRQDQIPECQILVTDRVDRNYVYYVQKTFEDRLIKVNVLDISPRVSMSAVIRQMIIEGVFAVVVLNGNLQDQAKLSLQVFEKTPGASSVRFDEYVEVDIAVGVEIVSRTKQKLQPQLIPHTSSATALQYILGALTQQQQQQQQQPAQAYPGQSALPPHNPY